MTATAFWSSCKSVRDRVYAFTILIISRTSKRRHSKWVQALGIQYSVGQLAVIFRRSS
jgi:hypothetical protein